VTEKRPDGFHNIETVFFPIPLKDALEILPSDSLQLNISGAGVPGDPASNLCSKAYNLLKTDFPSLPAVTMFLHKAIPIGAGLGGGSSNGAFTLALLNKKFRLAISDEKLREYALQLGSDCPFFILNKPCIATGRGEVMKEIAVALGDYYFVIVDSGIHVNTGWAFGQVTHRGASHHASREGIGGIISLPVETWRDKLANDFEQPVFKEYPSLKDIKEKLYSAGAIYASLTGTGGCVYGIFNRRIGDLKFDKEYKVYHLNKDH
jgi:4-diphosphocytidyl-2-C-methyl-D-erythritol kinase